MRSTDLTQVKKSCLAKILNSFKIFWLKETTHVRSSKYNTFCLSPDLSRGGVVGVPHAAVWRAARRDPDANGPDAHGGRGSGGGVVQVQRELYHLYHHHRKVGHHGPHCWNTFHNTPHIQWNLRIPNFFKSMAQHKTMPNSRASPAEWLARSSRKPEVSLHVGSNPGNGVSSFIEKKYPSLLGDGR